MNLLLLLLLCISPAKARHPLRIRFVNDVGREALVLGDKTYRNTFDEPFTVQQCKYYITALSGVNRHGEELLLSQPHLVDQGDSASLDLALTTSLDSIESIRFSVGVDSIYNTGGVQSGDLDPMLGMFWTWNTGYIYARLEGISDSARAPAHRFTWDVGGYRARANALRMVTLRLAAPQGVAADPNSGTPQGVTTLSIHNDLLRWFDGVCSVALSRQPVCHEPGNLAMQLADNYSTGFSLRR